VSAPRLRIRVLRNDASGSSPERSMAERHLPAGQTLCPPLPSIFILPRTNGSPMDKSVLFGTPMPTLHSQLNALAESFASAVLDAIRGAPLEELLGEAGGRSSARRSPQPNGAAAGRSTAAPKRAPRKAGRLPRRSADDITRALEEVVGLVGRHKEGLRAEQIRSELNMQANEMPRILKEGLASRKLRSKGQKRATTYFAK
jgi:hypothetical protein